MNSNNPLLERLAPEDLPAFSAIKPEHVEPAIRQLIDEARLAVNQAAEQDEPRWDNVVAPIEAAEDRLGRAFSPVRHLHSVMDAPALREAYQAVLPLLTAFSTETGQNKALYETYRALADSEAFGRMDAASQKVLQDALRDFRLSGVALEGEARERYGQIMQRLSELSTRFQQNLMDATKAWTKHIEDESLLAGLPESARALLEQNARNKDKPGWLLTLDAPSFMAIMDFADDRALRREIYTAYTTRASDQGPETGDFDNSALMNEILELRQEVSALLGFANYAEYSLTTKMASDPADVESFLLDLAERTRPLAARELDELTAFAREAGLPDELQAWDVAYYSEKLKQARYELASEDLKPYFPAPAVINGLFEVVQRLYGLRITATDQPETWHRDVTCYEIRGAENDLRGLFYLDPYAREDKRGGAWMDECRVRRRTEQGVQLPVAYLTCNFNPPIGDAPALLTHDEVTTLFHEFGHGLHHMLTRMELAPISGINGVEWDAVELPSQFMENWCWHREALDLFARHHETGETMPQALFDKLSASRNFMAGWQMLRQVEFSLFDLRLHRDFTAGDNDRVQNTLEQVRREVAVLSPPAWNRFANGFGHIFAGGYAAGYYSYKWAEVLSADAFSAFEETSLFDPQTGKRFLTEILEQGASRPAMESFVAFRGREPDITALLRHSGLEQQAA